MASGPARHEAARRRAQATVEFSLCAILLFTVICAIFEFGWVLYNLSYLNNAVSKAARLGVTGADNATITAAVVGAVGGLPIGTPTITVTTIAGGTVINTDRTPGNLLTVSASINYPNLTPLSRLVKMASFGTLTVSNVCRLE